MEWKKRNGEIVEKIVTQIQKQWKNYKKSIDMNDFDEVSRRIAMLNRPFILECLENVNGVFTNLKIAVSSATLISKLMGLLEHLVCLMPEVGATTCVLVRDRVADIVSHTIVYIKNQRLKSIRGEWLRRSQNEIEVSSLKSGVKKNKNIDEVKKHVHLDDSKEIIGMSSYNEFIGCIKAVSEQTPEKVV